jgi:hypothetical protein
MCLVRYVYDTQILAEDKLQSKSLCQEKQQFRKIHGDKQILITHTIRRVPGTGTNTKCCTVPNFRKIFMLSGGKVSQEMYVE